MTSKREDIIETTCRLLEIQGYHATGLSQIIEASGAPKGSLYYYFPEGKEGLTVEAVRRIGDLVAQHIRDVLAQHDEPGEAVAAFITGLAARVEASDYTAGGPIATVALESAAASDRLRRTCAEVYGSWEQAFRRRLEAAGIATEAAEAMASTILACIEGAIILSRTQRSRTPLDRAAGQLKRLVEAAAAAPA